MPLNLDTPLPISAQVDALEIDSFAVDLDRSEMVIGYTQLAAGARVKQAVAVIGGLDYMASINRANEIANTMPVGECNVYGAIKLALYEHLIVVTGQTGTVA